MASASSQTSKQHAVKHSAAGACFRRSQLRTMLRTRRCGPGAVSAVSVLSLSSVVGLAEERGRTALRGGAAPSALTT